MYVGCVCDNDNDLSEEELCDLCVGVDGYNWGVIVAGDRARKRRDLQEKNQNIRNAAMRKRRCSKKRAKDDQGGSNS